MEEGEGKVVGLPTMKPPEVHHGYKNNQDRRARDRDILRLVNKRQEMSLLKGQRIETWDATVAQANNSNQASMSARRVRSRLCELTQPHSSSAELE